MGRYVEDVIDETEWLRNFGQQRMSKPCSNQKMAELLERDRQLQQELVVLYAKRDMRTSAGENVYTRRGHP